MQLLAVTKASSPDYPGMTRLAGTIKFDHETKPRVYWFDFPDSYAAHLTDDGNPWLVLMTALAAMHGGDIDIALPVDARLHGMAQCARNQWRQWNAKLHAGSVRATQIVPAMPAGKGIALFLSGGADSYHSLLINQQKHPMSLPANAITHAIQVWGYDVPLRNAPLFKSLRDKTAATIAPLGVQHIPVISNIKNVAYDATDHWVGLLHGPALVAVALMLRPLLGEAVIASSYLYGRLQEPYGSHPLVDPLLGLQNLHITHDGAWRSRVQKINDLVAAPHLLRGLHVCLNTDRSPADLQRSLNCSACEKCLRTMTLLDLAGAKPQAVTFDWSGYGPDLIAQSFIGTRGLITVYRATEKMARAAGRADLADGINRAIKHSSRWLWLYDLERYALKHFQQLRHHRDFLHGWQKQIYGWLGLKK
jgi:hypothetical protein